MWEISTVRCLLPYLQPSLVGCCFGALSDQWCCDNGFDSLKVACSSDSSDPFVCLQVAQLGALSAVAYMDLVPVWPCRRHSTWWVRYDLRLGHGGITVWLHERGLPMVPCLIPHSVHQGMPGWVLPCCSFRFVVPLRRFGRSPCGL